MAWNQRSGRRDHRGDPGRPDLPGRARPTGLRPVSGCSPSLTGTLNQQMITATPVRSSKSWRQAAAFGRIRSPFSLSMTECHALPGSQSLDAWFMASQTS
jgi:hypothetical protein